MNSWLTGRHRNAGRNGRLSNTDSERRQRRRVEEDHSHRRRRRGARRRDSHSRNRVADLAEAEKRQRGGLGPVEQGGQPVGVRTGAGRERRRGADLRAQDGGGAGLSAQPLGDVVLLAPRRPQRPRRIRAVALPVRHAGNACQPAAARASGLMSPRHLLLDGRAGEPSPCVPRRKRLTNRYISCSSERRPAHREPGSKCIVPRERHAFHVIPISPAI